jgi:hypothetical protein
LINTHNLCHLPIILYKVARRIPNAYWWVSTTLPSKLVTLLVLELNISCEEETLKKEKEEELDMSGTGNDVLKLVRWGFSKNMLNNSFLSTTKNIPPTTKRQRKT